MALLSALSRYNSQSRRTTESEMMRKARREAELSCEFSCIQDELETQKAATHPSFSAIPTLISFSRKTKGTARTQLVNLVKDEQLRRMDQSLPTDKDLQELYQTLCNCASGLLGFPPSPRFDYTTFKKVSDMVTPKCKQFFTARVFSSFSADEAGCIPITAIYKYAVRTVSLRRARIELDKADKDKQGLTESSLEDYIYRMIPSVVESGMRPGLRESDKATYIQMAVRKFFFLLNVTPQRRLPVMELLGSDELKQFLSLRTSGGHEHMNWFSPINFDRVKRMWRELDLDQDGMLVPKDLDRFGSRTYSPLFVSRLFEVHAKDGMMGFRGFLDLLLATENRTTLPSLRYFFKVLDLEQKGYLDAMTIHAFVRTMGLMLMQHGHCPGGGEVEFDTHEARVLQLERHCREVRGEVFDLVGPQDDNTKITLQDLKACGVGSTVVSMLIEMRGFWAYENREIPMITPDSQEPEPEPQTQLQSTTNPPSVPVMPTQSSSTGVVNPAFQSYGDDSESDEFEDDFEDDDDVYNFDDGF